MGSADVARAGIAKVLSTSGLPAHIQLEILQNLMSLDKDDPRYKMAKTEVAEIAINLSEEEMARIVAEVEALRGAGDPAEALKKANAMQDKLVDRALDIRQALHSSDPKQRAIARRLKKGRHEIKALSTRVDNLESQKRAIVLNLFREYEIKGDSSSPREIETLMMLMANINSGAESVADTILENLSNSDHFKRYFGWAGEWKKCAFARLSVGAKLGAALMLTDAPDEVVAPWDAWSLCVPDGIIKTVRGSSLVLPHDGHRIPISSNTFSIMRLWCYGTEPVAAIAKSDTDTGSTFINDMDGVEKPWMTLARNFVKGACLSLAIDVETHRNKSWGGPRGSKRAPGVVPGAGVDYVLGGTVGIDLRDEVRRICEGRKTTGGHSPTVQFLVRGHWRNQAVGVRHSDRKRIWIEPFWKGPEESRVLLRTHRIKTEDEET